MKSNSKGKTKKILLWVTGVTTVLASVAVFVPVGITINQSLNTQTDQDNTQKPGQGGNDDTNKPGGNGEDKPGNGDNNSENNSGNGNDGNNNGSGQEPSPQPEPKPEQSIKPVIKAEVKEIGLVDQILEKDPNANITNYWNEFFKEANNKQSLLSNANDFNNDQINGLNISVTPVEQLKQWGGTTTYDTWKNTIDSTVYYSPSLDIFTIKDLNDLKTQLNNDAGLEKILNSSGYTTTADNTYSVESNSQIYLDTSKDHVQINILEDVKDAKAEDKNINLKLPVSDLVVKSKYNVTLTTDDKSIDLSETNNSQIDLNYTVGISDENTKTVESLNVVVNSADEQYTEENILKGLNFLNPAPATRAASDLNNRLNNQEISSASNIFNVTWTDPQLVGEPANPTAIQLQATPTDGHVWAVDESTTPKPIEFPIKALTRTIADATMPAEAEQTYTRNLGQNTKYTYNEAGFKNVWNDYKTGNQQFVTSVLDTFMSSSVSIQDIKTQEPIRFEEYRPRYDVNGMKVTYSVSPLEGHAWTDGTTEAKEYSFIIVGLVGWKW